MRCANCRFENPQGFKFCGECGTPLTDKHLGFQHKKRIEAERRHLTVMFCDLVGSTNLSKQLEPEEFHEVIRTYQGVCRRVIHRYEGHIAQYMGDGILVYFSYPLSHEDDAKRAIKAALEILGAVGAIHKSPPSRTRLQQPLQVRIGIHSGPVFVGGIGERGKREMLALGDTVNIAAHMQKLVDPNKVVISSSNYPLVEGLFEFKEIGSTELEGLPPQMKLYEVLGERMVSRFEPVSVRGLTPLVGRQTELRILFDSWDRVKRGEGQAVLISGEAGIGKSRLVHELKEQINGKSHTLLESQCLPYFQNSDFYPLIYLMERMVCFRKEDSQEEKAKKLESFVEEYGFSVEEAVPLFIPLLSLRLPGHYKPSNLTPQRQKEKTLEALVYCILRESEKKPVLFIMEDLQWVDPSTIEFLNLLIAQIPNSPICTLLSFRPDFSHTWNGSHLINLTLDKLEKKEIEVMTDNVTKGKILPSEVLQDIVTKSDGIPLFVEELTKMVLESGLLKEGDKGYELTGTLPQVAIPATLQDSLVARLGRVSRVKDVVQIGATIGREFSYDLLRSVSTLDETTLRRELGRLVEAELLFQLDMGYAFKHALIRDAAYQSMQKSKRQEYHKRISEGLEERFQDFAATKPELLAHHYTEAGLSEKAMSYWIKAGQRAVERSANKEAISHLTKALELLETLPETKERNEKELSVLVLLGSALGLTKGFSSPEVEENYNRATELCRLLGDPPQLFPVLLGLTIFYSFRDLNVCRELIDKLFKIAESSKDPSFFIWSHSNMSAILYWEGELHSSLEHHNTAIAIAETESSYNKFGFYDPVLLSLFYKVWVLWSLGYPDQASETIHRVQVMAQNTANPADLTCSMAFTAMFHCNRREFESTRKMSEELIAYATEFGLPFYTWLGRVHRGWALIHGPYGDSSFEAGDLIDQMWEGIDDVQAIRKETITQIIAARFAEVYLKTNQIGAGLNFVNEQVGFIGRQGLHFLELELIRIKGNLLLAQSVEDGVEAEACFRHAIELARRHGAKSLELRAVMDLSHLLKKQGKKVEARQMLSEIYGWFTEGFDTRDLIEAKALLDELTE